MPQRYAGDFALDTIATQSGTVNLHFASVAGYEVMGCELFR